MPGTPAGGRKTAETIKKRYGPAFYERIGSMGGKISKGGGFAANRELASEAGRKGGLKSRKPKKLDKVSPTEFAELEKATEEKAHKNWKERIGL